MTISQRIANILAASKAARNDDFELWLIYAQKSGVDLSARQIDQLRNMPSFETLRRCRQKIQASGDYQADPTVKRARKSQATRMRKSITYMRPDDVARELSHRQSVPDWLKGVDGH
jgi:hypothetical protein